MAEMAVVYRGGLLPLRGDAQMAYNYRFPTRTTFVLNKFRIGKERHFQMREHRASHLVGWKNSSYYIAPVGVRTHDLPHTVASNMVKVSYTLTTRPRRRS